ncbi:hypothetical protein VTK73DRAFT_8480 [Phialemonium thermophilum]|uniref:GST N-terminal domain-containing protein n=1 Tax=Phialemonium thermophilum TaxID=223376 RepID=A0ABR3W8B6_9PEZI
MSKGTITLFDIPTKAPRKCWSLNPWKTRLLFNYKGLDYKVEWLEYPDIQPRLEPHLPPHPEQRIYTIPTIMLPDGTYVMDSRKIADVIEQRYPEKPVHLDSPYLARLEPIMAKLVPALWPVFIPHEPTRVLGERSLPFWYETREKYLGMTMDEYQRGNPPEPAWEKAEPYIREVTAMLKENPDGPFFMGHTVSYADFVWVGFLLFMKAIGEDEFHGVLERSGDGEVHKAILEATRPWWERDGD